MVISYGYILDNVGLQHVFSYLELGTLSLRLNIYEWFDNSLIVDDMISQTNLTKIDFDTILENGFRSNSTNKFIKWYLRSPIYFILAIFIDDVKSLHKYS